MTDMKLSTVVLMQALLWASASLAFAQANYTGDTVTCLTNGTQLKQGGASVPLTNTLTLAPDIEVFTNCMFRVKEGKDRPLREGQILRADGFLLNADGSIGPVRDHIEMSKGVVLIYTDGKGSALTSTLELPDGTSISPDGSYLRPSGRRSRLADGQLLTPEGTPIEGLDTLTLRGGKVVVYKDGALIPLQSAVVIMGLADGTRVRGDGYITSQNGTTSQLEEGQTITVPSLRRDF